jgi:aminopeptidase N
MRPITVVLAGLLIGAAGRVASAHDPADPCFDASKLPCGKARAMAAGYGTDESGSSTREAMGETDVLNYALNLEVTNVSTAGNTCTITGTNAMTIKSKSAALTQFTFRLRSQYTITSATVTDGVNTVPVTVSLSGTTTRITTLTRAYGMDEVFVLTIAYTGTSASRGFGSIDVAVQTGGSTAIVETLSEAYFAYTWWPCKDGDTFVPGDNSDKATMQMSITAPNNWVVPSNGLLEGVDVLSGNRLRYRWATNYQTATYLFCFAMTNYNTWTQTYNFPAGPYNPAGSMPVMFYIYPGNDSPGNRAAWENCLNMMATYRGFYGEYPFVNEKYGIYNFNFGGGMEHQTITGEGTFSESVTAHELGHQWWGDNVTCRTWSDIWVNEGFADYTECLWEERKAGGINTPRISMH